ncbi:MAG: Ribulose-phosphate 3-epimerase [Parcubacteria group bacterium GW2011_GWA2_36_24]|nr:MAG: Ribulose-phosphate 3-epimerase [Parcubacteria group bacterium GW2011_GWA2_36_24]
MSEIIPAILEKNFNEIKNKLTVLRENARCAHIDLCDGLLVPSQSWPFASGGFDDFDFRKIIKRLIFHPDLGGEIEEFEHFLEGLDMYIRDNVEIGIAFKPRDDLSVVSRLSHKADFLHCMGSDKIGFQGENFSDKALENIKFLKKNLPGIRISVDIGINLENVEIILNAGADRLTIGSSIWKNLDPIGALQSFQNLV